MIYSTRILTGNGIILPSSPIKKYRVAYFSLLFSSGCNVVLFFGDTYNGDTSRVFFAHEAATGEALTIDVSLFLSDNLTLFEGEVGEAVGIYTDSSTTPKDYSFMRYEEIGVA